MHLSAMLIIRRQAAFYSETGEKYSEKVSLLSFRKYPSSDISGIIGATRKTGGSNWGYKPLVLARA